MANNAKQDSKERLRSLEQRKKRKRNQRPKPGSFEYVSNVSVPGNYRLSYS
jgi:hypothetical protein